MPEKLTKGQVAHVAHLARLELSDQEIEKYTEELSGILAYVDQLSGVDTAGVKPVSQVTGLVNRLAEDNVGGNSVKREEFLSGAPSTEPPYVKVKTVLE